MTATARSSNGTQRRVVTRRPMRSSKIGLTCSLLGSTEEKKELESDSLAFAHVFNMAFMLFSFILIFLLMFFLSPFSPFFGGTLDLSGHTVVQPTGVWGIEKDSNSNRSRAVMLGEIAGDWNLAAPSC